jgi:hypothetical protein
MASPRAERDSECDTGGWSSVVSLEWPEDTQHEAPPLRRTITDPLYISREVAGDYDRERRDARTYLVPGLVLIIILLMIGAVLVIVGPLPRVFPLMN